MHRQIKIAGVKGVKKKKEKNTHTHKKKTKSALMLSKLCGLWFLVHIQFSSVPCPAGSSGGHDRRFSRAPLPAFSAGGLCEQFRHGQGCSLYDAVHPAFPLPTQYIVTHTLPFICETYTHVSDVPALLPF